MELEESLKIPAWHLAHNRGRGRQVIILLDQNVLDAMRTDDPIWMMQASFQSFTPRRAHHLAQHNPMAILVVTLHY